MERDPALSVNNKGIKENARVRRAAAKVTEVLTLSPH